MTHGYALALLALVAAVPRAQAAPPGQDPDWPCAQLLVPVLAAGAYWDGAVPTNTAWRDDEKIFALVPDIVNRDTKNEDALARLSTYADAIPPAQRATAYPLLFSALVDETNDERTVLIDRIKQLGQRQRRMGDVIASISSQADAVPAADPRHADLVGERDFDVRAFQETQHTMRYACEAPADMERRLGVMARLLEARLKQK
jgi:hypothetical protein